jgi:hypothetical protein
VVREHEGEPATAGLRQQILERPGEDEVVVHLVHGERYACPMRKAGLDLSCLSLLRWIVCRSIRPTHPAPGGDPSGDVVRVAPDTLDLLGGHCIEELETDEVETGFRSDYPTTVKRLLRAEYRKVDP